MMRSHLYSGDREYLPEGRSNILYDVQSGGHNWQTSQGDAWTGRKELAMPMVPSQNMALLPPPTNPMAVRQYAPSSAVVADYSVPPPGYSQPPGQHAQIPLVQQRSSDPLVDNRQPHMQFRAPNVIQPQRPAMQHLPPPQMPHRYEQPGPRMWPQYASQQNTTPMSSMPQLPAPQQQFAQQPYQQLQYLQPQQQYQQQQLQFQQQHQQHLIRQQMFGQAEQQQQESMQHRSWPSQMTQTGVMSAPQMIVPQPQAYPDGRSLPVAQFPDGQSQLVQASNMEAMYQGSGSIHQPDKFYSGQPLGSGVGVERQPMWAAEQPQRPLYNPPQHYTASLPNSLESGSAFNSQYAGGSGMYDVQQQHQQKQQSYYVPQAGTSDALAHHPLPPPSQQQLLLQHQQQPMNVPRQQPAALASWSTHHPPPPPSSAAVPTTSMTATAYGGVTKRERKPIAIIDPISKRNVTKPDPSDDILLSKMSELSMSDSARKEIESSSRRSPADYPDVCCSASATQPAVSAAQPSVTTDQPAVCTSQPATSCDHSVVSVHVEQTAVSSTQSSVSADQLPDSTDQSSALADQSSVHADQSSASANELPLSLFLSSPEPNSVKECTSSLSKTDTGAVDDLVSCVAESALPACSVAADSSVNDCDLSSVHCDAITPGRELSEASEAENAASAQVHSEDKEKNYTVSTDVSSIQNVENNAGWEAASDQSDAVACSQSDVVNTNDHIDEAVIVSDSCCSGPPNNSQSGTVNTQEDDNTSVNTLHSKIQRNIHSDVVPISVQTDVISVEAESVNLTAADADAVSVDSIPTCLTDVSDEVRVTPVNSLEKISDEVAKETEVSRSSEEMSSLAEAVMVDTLAATDEYMAEVARSIVQDCFAQLLGSHSHTDSVPEVSSADSRSTAAEEETEAAAVSSYEVSYEAISSDVECDIESAICDEEMTANSPSIAAVDAAIDVVADEARSLQRSDAEVPTRSLQRSDSEVSSSSCVLVDHPESSLNLDVTSRGPTDVRHERSSNRHKGHSHGRIIDGIRKYDRKFLLRFQKQYYPRPVNLPNIPEIMRPVVEPLQRKVITLDINSSQSLHRSDCAWKPHFSATGSNNGDEALFGKLRSVLNKLTHQNFEIILEQVIQLDLSTVSRRDKSLDIIFEKAIAEPSYSVDYAKLCQRLIEAPVVSELQAGVSEFRKLLIHRCQRQFESNDAEELELNKKQKIIDETVNEEEKKVLSDALAEAKFKARRRSLGNIRFIGELFKLGILTEMIMHRCIVTLLRNGDDENLECLCGLLKTIGKTIDLAKAKARMDQYFIHIQKIIQMKKVCSRTRFFLQDIIELRLNGWLPRRAETVAKGAKQGQGRGEVKENNALAQSQGHAQNTWLAGDRASGEQADVPPVKLPSVRSNSDVGQAMLMQERFLVDHTSDNNSTRGGRRSLSTSEDQRRVSFDNAPSKQLSTSCNSELKSVPVYGGLQRPPSQSSIPSAADLGQSVRALLHRHCRDGQVEDTLGRVRDLMAQWEPSSVVSSLVAECMDMDSRAHSQVAAIVTELLRVRCISPDHLFAGIGEVLSSSEDLIIDNPQFWRCMAEFLHPLMKNAIMSVVQLRSLCGGEEQFHLLTKELASLNSASEAVPLSPESTNFAAIVWMRSLHQLRDNIGPLLLSADVSNEVITRLIDDFAAATKPSNEMRADIVHIVIAALCATAICFPERFIKLEQVRRRCAVIGKCVMGDMNCQQRALLALEEFAITLHHPPGILKKLFEMMYNENVISVAAFAHWDRDARPVFPPAEHDKSRQSVVQFFAWLQEADDDVE